MQTFAFSAAGDGKEQSLHHFARVRFISYRLLAAWNKTRPITYNGSTYLPMHASDKMFAAGSLK
ncbi:hypothetical protein GCM10007362_13330 [Saccharibacillus endophyticus]|uniref:Uncharacterized protein n=1 Tax=Saccharibacillus endophyticus TaxID=2060666 RepID=A0ABQ1ZQR6_9BACL|nr:hypothetical protein GCM10007362_13330 [Saccharibacillus endophyticus]